MIQIIHPIWVFWAEQIKVLWSIKIKLMMLINTQLIKHSEVISNILHLTTKKSSLKKQLHLCHYGIRKTLIVYQKWNRDLFLIWIKVMSRRGMETCLERRKILVLLGISWVVSIDQRPKIPLLFPIMMKLKMIQKKV